MKELTNNFLHVGAEMRFTSVGILLLFLGCSSSNPQVDEKNKVSTKTFDSKENEQQYWSKIECERSNSFIPLLTEGAVVFEDEIVPYEVWERCNGFEIRWLEKGKLAYLAKSNDIYSLDLTWRSSLSAYGEEDLKALGEEPYKKWGQLSLKDLQDNPPEWGVLLLRTALGEEYDLFYREFTKAKYGEKEKFEILLKENVIHVTPALHSIFLRVSPRKNYDATKEIPEEFKLL